MFLKKYDIALEKFITLQKAYYKNGHKADLELCDLNIATVNIFSATIGSPIFSIEKVFIVIITKFEQNHFMVFV